MVVVVVRDHDGVDKGNVLNLTGLLREPFGADPLRRRTALFEDWIKECSEPSGKLNIVAGMSEPGSPERLDVSLRRECRLVDRYGWWCGIWRTTFP